MLGQTENMMSFTFTEENEAVPSSTLSPILATMEWEFLGNSNNLAQMKLEINDGINDLKGRAKGLSKRTSRWSCQLEIMNLAWQHWGKENCVFCDELRSLR